VNLHIARPYEQPLFIRRTILPLIPFVATAVLIVGYGAINDTTSHRVLQQVQAELPTTDVVQQQTAELRMYENYRNLLATLYTTKATTMKSLRALHALAEALPRTVRLTNVTFNDSATQLAITAELTDPQRDVDVFIANAQKRHWLFHLNALSPAGAKLYQMQGDLLLPAEPLTPIAARSVNHNTPTNPHPLAAHGKQTPTALTHPTVRLSHTTSARHIVTLQKASSSSSHSAPSHFTPPRPLAPRGRPSPQ
jgi:hypothetical protein